MKYKYILFDLDNTIYDFDKSAKQALEELFSKYGFDSHFNTFDTFFETYITINDQMWALYRAGKIDKKILSKSRFKKLMDIAGIVQENLDEIISKEYLEIQSTKKNLIPGAIEILEYLLPKYPMHLLTNGFEEVQKKKMKTCQLEKYFGHLITSERAGVLKPNSVFFAFALETINADPAECLMIGDNLEVDILGAKNFGIDQVYFNPDKISHNEKISYEINSLVKLREIL